MSPELLYAVGLSLDSNSLDVEYLDEENNLASQTISATEDSKKI